MDDDLTLEKLDQLRVNENPWNDPFTRRELIALREREFLQQQHDLHERVNRTYLERPFASDRLKCAQDASELLVWEGPYKDIGIQQVELAQIINIPERGTLSFDKTSEADMVAGFRKLEAIQRQPAAVRLDYCRQQDAALQLTGRATYEHVYGCFYGNDSSSSITLVQVPNGYEITAGRHRTYVARELGWNSVPARVKVPDTSGS